MSGFPSHGHRVVPWRTQGRGPKADRMLSEVVVSIPPRLAEIELRLSKATELDVVAATQEIAAFDAGPGHHLAGLGSFLLRTESVASSRIERVEARQIDLAKAVAGLRTSDEAKLTWSAVTAVERLIDRAGTQQRIDQDDLLQAHRLLLQDDWNERPFAGQWRTVQNWIGGSDYSPRDAVHVPPPPDELPPLIDDLVRYVNRDDVPALTQAAIAHAQFESIHPFTDGNGRIGRGLISAVIRRRRLATVAVIPIASALLADTHRYFTALNDYRDGAADEFVGYLARAAIVATVAARATAAVLSELPAAWRDRARPRGGSTDEALLDLLLAHPVIDVGDVSHLTGASFNAAAGACARLEAAGVLTPVTRRARDRAWMATEVLDEITELNRRIGPRLPS